MKASELVERLQGLIEEHGDLDVKYTHLEDYLPSSSIEANEVVVEEYSFVDTLVDEPEGQLKIIKFFEIS